MQLIKNKKEKKWKLHLSIDNLEKTLIKNS